MRWHIETFVIYSWQLPKAYQNRFDFGPGATVRYRIVYYKILWWRITVAEYYFGLMRCVIPGNDYPAHMRAINGPTRIEFHKGYLKR